MKNKIKQVIQLPSYHQQQGGISSMGPAKPGKGIELHSGSEQWRQHSLF